MRDEPMEPEGGGGGAGGLPLHVWSTSAGPNATPPGQSEHKHGAMETQQWGKQRQDNKSYYVTILIQAVCYTGFPKECCL